MDLTIQKEVGKMVLENFCVKLRQKNGENLKIASPKNPKNAFLDNFIVKISLMRA